MGVQVTVLGHVEASLDGVPLDLGTPKQRSLVAALALSAGRPVSVDALVDLLWGDHAPSTVTGTLQAYVSVLRRTLEPHREKRAPAEVLVTVAPGYALRLPDGALDARAFDQVVTEEHRRLSGPLLGPSPLPRDGLEAGVARLGEALDLWRGTPYADLDDAPAVVAERAHLDELRLVALEDRAVARLALGDHGTTAADLEALTTAHPLRERLWALRALALVRSGRQADALEVLRTVREVLADELGLDPGAELLDLQDRVLRQDPELAFVAPAGSARSTPATPGQAGPPAAPATTPATAPTVTPPSPVGPESPWPLLGRDDELRALRGALTAVRRGQPGFVVLTGEPGIGKSRLAAEIASLARAYGHTVAVGRCSQDEGAPPLWPWRSVFDTLGTPLPGADGAAEGADFRSWERIARSVEDLAGEQPITLVLEDLHWADTATLRVLRLLTEVQSAVPLLVVLTWRDRPEPQDALADLSESLGRRHALRLELRGVDESSVGAMVSVVTRRRIEPEQARILRERTEGNPFFLIEYARAWRAGTELDDLLRAEAPIAVREVIVRRLSRLPENTRAALGTAAVVGRRFDVATLSAAIGDDEEDLLDRLEPAQAAGLVHEAGVDTFTFDHALVRDTVYGNLSASRRARRHGQVADVLARRGGHETEAAHHLLAAGPSRAAAAWRAAVEAGDLALATNTYPEAASLYRRALTAQESDADATPRQRYDVLMSLVVAHRWAANWPDLNAAVLEAIPLADGLGDPALVARAAIAPTHGAMWQTTRYGDVQHEVVAALRRTLRDLPEEDSDLRCRCLVSLGNELYYAASLQERRAVTDEALAMADRLGDPDLRLHACLVAFITLWTPDTADERRELAATALAIAREKGDEHSQVLAGTLMAIALGELGQPGPMWEVFEDTRARAERLRYVYALLVLDSMTVPWLAMAGRFDEAEARLTSMIELATQSSLHQVDDAIQGNFLALALWRDHRAPDGLVETLERMPFPMTAAVAASLWIFGEDRQAVDYLSTHEVDLTRQDWFSMLNWCWGAVASVCSPDADLGAEVYRLLAPFAGHGCSAGSGLSNGPVDAYLALAAYATGELEVAARHADDAARLAEEWQIPLFTAWLREQRDRLGF